MKISVLIPVFNEEGTIQEVLRKVRENLPEELEKEIIVIDDGSTDSSLKKLQNEKGIVLVSLPVRRGKGGALKEGFSRASGDFILIQDADLEYAPEDYAALLAPIIKNESQAVFGSRELLPNKRNRFYAIGNTLVTFFFNKKFKTRLTDIATCYKLFPREVIGDLIKSRENDFAFDVFRITLSLVRKGYKITEVPIHYSPRGKKQGKKLNPIHGLHILFLVLLEPQNYHA